MGHPRDRVALALPAPTLPVPHPVGSVEWYCTIESWPGPTGLIVVLRVAGDIDLVTYPTLSAAVDTALFGTVEQPTAHLVVDLAGVGICCARGMELLVGTSTVAALTATSYVLSGCPASLQRCWFLVHGETLDTTVANRYAAAAFAGTTNRLPDQHRSAPAVPGRPLSLVSGRPPTPRPALVRTPRTPPGRR